MRFVVSFVVVFVVGLCVVVRFVVGLVVGFVVGLCVVVRFVVGLVVGFVVGLCVVVRFVVGFVVNFVVTIGFVVVTLCFVIFCLQLSLQKSSWQHRGQWLTTLVPRLPTAVPS